MPKIDIVDANNFFRRGFEAGKSVSDAVPMNPPNLTIYIFDGMWAKKQRLELFPEYKAKRDVQAAVDNGFFTFLKAIREELLPHCANTWVIRKDGMEADDVIAALTDQVKVANQVVIHSNDADFQALLCDNVTITDRTKKLSHVEPKDIRLYKTLVGDTSDNISGIEGLGNAYWLKLDEEDKAQWVIFLTGQSEDYPIIGLTAAKFNWIAANVQLLRTFYTIVGFMPVDLQDVFMRSLVKAEFNPSEYQKTMMRYYWV